MKVYPGIAARRTCARTSTRARSSSGPSASSSEGAESYAWLPFGGGIRRCLGAALAQAEMAEVLRIAVPGSRTSARCTPEPDPVVLRGITLAPKHGVEVSVERRLDGAVTRERPRAAVAAV